MVHRKNIIATPGDGQVSPTWDAVRDAFMNGDGYHMIYTDCTGEKVSDLLDMPCQEITETSAVDTGLSAGKS